MSEFGHVTIVTGAAGALGRSIALTLSAQNHAIVLVDKDGQGLHRVTRSLGRAATTLSADVTDADTIPAAVELALGRFGALSGLVNNAGIEGRSGLIEEQDPELYDRVMAVNVRSVFLGLRGVLPHLKERGAGAVVNIASSAGLEGTPGRSPYLASKHAVIGLTRAAAVEAAPHGVRVNTVAPGAIDSPMMQRIEDQAGTDDRGRRLAAATTPLRRYGTPGEVAAVVAFLMSDAASYVTNSIYTVDGGRLSV